MQDPLTRRGSLGGLLAAAAAFGGATGTVAAAAAPPQQRTVSAGAIVLEGAGIDPTGQRDSRDAVQAVIDAAPEGSEIVNPSGAVLRLDGGLTVRTPHTRLTGPGEWRFRAGGEYTDGPDGQIGFVDVRADHCWLDGLFVTNPDAVLNRGVMLLADFGRVTDCTLIGFGSGIHVAPSGEFHDFTISGNHVLDVLGRGGGPDSTSSAGEDYGDGIVCWGAAVTVTGNVVTCKEGSDARIGIHVEALADLARTPWTHGNALATITGNVVHGRFRRGIVSEEVDHVAITANVVADATWWSVALVSASHCVVSGNALLYSRTAADTQGSAWGPSRSAVMLYGVAGRPIVDPVIADNTVLVPAGATAEAGIRITGADEATTVVEGGRIAGNRVLGEGALAFGLRVDRTTADLEVAGNRFAGFTRTGIALTTHDGASIDGNRIAPAASTGDGIEVAAGSRLTVTGNTVTGGGVGIAALGQTAWTAVRGNTLERLTTGIDLTGSTGVVQCSDNLAVDVTTPRAGLPAGATAVGNTP